MEVQVGVDVGGTFTDVVTIRDSEISVEKVPSNPDAPEQGVANALSAADIDEFDMLVHGTTVATNAVLEHEWAHTGLITTQGFRDVLEIGRGDRPAIYDLQTVRPAPVIPRDRRFEVQERLTERGAIETPLSDETVEAVIDHLDAAEVESVAISLLFSFENDAHERALVEAITERLPDVSVTRSSDVLPEIREYERTLATALNAALKPMMHRYLHRLERIVDAFDPSQSLRIMQSNGGTITASRAGGHPIRTLLSGPAAGVKGATHVAERIGEPDLITMDMGGTSCDVSLVEHGQPTVSTDIELGGYPIAVPMVDIHTIGAGGGSIGRIDDGGALRVGPQSAGADPGPICYGRGGTEPTVTDAQALLGRIDPSRFLPTERDDTTALVEERFRDAIGDSLGLSPAEAASGMLRVANANMERAIRVVSVERGYDPREFVLVAFGGAGPLHAPRIAEMLDIPRVIIPRSAGVLSALGLVMSDVLHDFSTSRVRSWDDLDPTKLEERFASFESTGRERLQESGFDLDRITFERTADMRYRGQSYTLNVGIPTPVDSEAMTVVSERFHAAHARRYGHDAPHDPIELVTLRVRARGRIDPPDLHASPEAPRGAPERETRSVWFGGERYDTPVLDRGSLKRGEDATGPLIIEGDDSTIAIQPEQRMRIDSYGSVIVDTVGDGS